MTKEKTHLYIDGQNFFSKVRAILARRGIKEPDFTKFDLWGLLNMIFVNTHVDLATFYVARVLPHEETKEKSTELLERQAQLQKHLERQGFKFVISGVVRARKNKQSSQISFEEKGVDVQIAVDMVVDSVKNRIKTAILASSDSDLQPAVAELERAGTKVTYLGFKSWPNKGLIHSTDKVVLLTNEDVTKFYPDIKE